MIIRDLTPNEFQCLVGTCPSVYGSEKDYFIVGEKVNPEDIGLQEKVGEGEVLIRIKKEIIDHKKSV